MHMHTHKYSIPNTKMWFFSKWGKCWAILNWPAGVDLKWGFAQVGEAENIEIKVLGWNYVLLNYTDTLLHTHKKKLADKS